MGFQNRDYARTGHSDSWNGMTEAPASRGILIVTVVVFLLQIFSTRLPEPARRTPVFQPLSDAVAEYDPELAEEIDSRIQIPTRARVSAVQEILQLETNKVLGGQVWRLLTSAFCHDRYTIWHIFLNMMFFWWFGPALESMYGSKEFLLFYLCAAVTASLAYVGLDILTGDPVPAIGASGAVMAVTALFAYHFPTHIIRVFFIIPVEIRWLVWIYALIDLHPVLLELSGDSFSDGVAHAAHLGGLAFGMAYSRRHWRLSPLLDWRPFGLSDRSTRKDRSGPGSAGSEQRDVLPFPTPRTSSVSKPAPLDEILDKIRESGQDSLTEEELQTLIRESQRLQRRRGQGKPEQSG